MSSLSIVWVRSGAPLKSGLTKGALAPVTNLNCHYSSDGRPKSETGRQSTMHSVTGDASTVPHLTAMKRGPGYRSSFSGRVATVFGNYGGLGRSVCSKMGRQGTQMILPYRCDQYDVMRMKVMGDLGQILFSEFELRDEESVKKAMKHSDVVINLIGKEHETLNYKFKDTNVDGARMIARCAREMGVKQFVHMSHINAEETPRSCFMPNGSEYLRTKWLGEQAVMEEFPDATIFKAVDMYGHMDYFVDYYNTFLRRGIGRSVPQWKKGKYIVKAPLTYGSMADGILAALDDPSAKGQTFEAMGPERFVLGDLIDFMHEIMDKTCEEWGYKRTDLRLDFLPILKGFAASYSPLGLKMFRSSTHDKLDRSQLSEYSLGLPDLNDLGVKLERVEEKMPEFAKMYQAFLYVDFSSGDNVRQPIHPLVPLTRLQEGKLQEEEKEISSMMKTIGLA